MVKAFVGSGGKTTLIKRQARQYRAEGKRVFVTTSTHMFIEEDTLLTDDAETILRELDRTGYVMAGRPEGVKIKALSRETYLRVCDRADVVLVEADGSRGLPIKFPGSGEPVIYDNVEQIVVVCGLQALGKPVRDVAHRLELVTRCLGGSEETIVTPEHIRKLLLEGYVRPLRQQYPGIPITVFPTSDGSAEQEAVRAVLTAVTDCGEDGV